MVGAGEGVVAGVVDALVGASVAGCGGEAAEGLVAAVLSPSGGGEFDAVDAGGAGDAAA